MHGANVKTIQYYILDNGHQQRTLHLSTNLYSDNKVWRKSHLIYR